jgi:hypothetical protein
MIKAKALKSKILSVVYIVIKDKSKSRRDLERAKKTIKATKTQVILDRISRSEKGADIDSFLTTYVRSGASKFTGGTSKQGNNNQTQAPSVPRASKCSTNCTCTTTCIVTCIATPNYSLV